MLIDALASRGNMDVAKGLLEEMEQRDVRPNVVTFNVLLSAMCVAKEWAASLRLLDDMETTGVAPDVRSYMQAAAACVSAGRPDMAEAVLEAMGSRGVASDARFYSFLMRTAVESGHWPYALEVMDALRWQHGLLEHISSPLGQSSPIIRSATSHHGPEDDEHGQPELAARGLWIAVARDKPPLSQYAYAIAMNACAKGRQGQAGLALFEEAQIQVGVNNVLYTTAIVACAKSRRWRDAIGLVKQMRSLEPPMPINDNRALNWAIYACASAHEWRLAVKLLDMIKAQGRDPDAWSFAAAITACAWSGKLDMAIELLGELVHRYQGPTQEAASYPGRNSRQNSAELAGSGLDWDQWLDGCNAEERKGLLVAFNAGLQAVKSAGRWEQATLLIETIKNVPGVEPDAGCYGEAAIVCAEQGQAAQALGLFDEMVQAGHEPRASLYPPLIKAATDSGQLSQALLLRHTFRVKHPEAALRFDQLEWDEKTQPPTPPPSKVSP